MRLIAISRRRHATRVGRNHAGGGVGEREALEQALRDLARILEVAQPGDEHHVLPSAEDLVHGGELSGEADRLSHFAGLPRDVKAVDRGAARVGFEQGRQDLHDGGLAGSVGAEQGEDAAGRHVEIDAAQHPQFAV